MENVARDAAQLQALLQQRPLFRLQEFASLLGWHGLRIRHLWLRNGEGDLPPGSVMVWYETTDARFHIHINEYPIGQWETHSAAVIAER